MNAKTQKAAPPAAEAPRPRFVTVTDETPEVIAAAAAQVAPPAEAAVLRPAPARPALNAKTRAEQAAGRHALSAYSDAPAAE